jgi:hypothetical protein
MSADKDLQAQKLPSARRLAQASGIALLVATGLLVTVVLPAEYGVDPLGTGAALGLVVLSTPASVPEEVGTVTNAAAPVPVQEGAVTHYPAEYRFDSREFALGPYEYVEYKYRLEKGASMLFSWTASSTVVHDFHGEPDGGPKGYAESFDKQGKRREDGSFTAPFSGIHGWYWENPGGETITVRVTSAGFYTSALEIHFDGTRQPRDVMALETIALLQKESGQ